MKKEMIIDIIAALIIMLFLYTGLSKLIGYSTFRDTLLKSPVFKSNAQYVAWIIPSVELLVSIMLAVPKYRLKGLYFAFVLMLLFTGYICYILFVSHDIPCTCGGIIQQMTWRQHLFFNGLFTLFPLIGILILRRQNKLLALKQGLINGTGK